MLEWSILIFLLFIVYIIMKKSNTTTEKTKSETEKTVTPEAVKETPKKASTTREAPKKAQTAEESKATMEQPVTPKTAKVTPKKSSSSLAATKKTSSPAPVAETPEISIRERVGLTAGTIWQYLDKNGETSVAKLIKELPEEEKIIQRSIGWLAQEGKITLSTVSRVETVALK
ncbi:winged helix-turn-helix domain-containing protein [Methylotuvimicrobium alcaliphilum]|uniref:Winged helix-turn-helix domain-containing protein n=1 Tax=Methylotuvimicrobium alcaliphilum (strain DSM 19304 / NCIMB 14124 / VKM B-2133 / 20Z) TaxID=1091494 RepID=G4T1R7_META2|nr:winged helix-turn-helix domain-containing protein [Methylotuvimicrobium alcaliphilum]CCE23499.1 conserved protein of unknown function [Methylotuvimicrobium alcaliphilum 20Z]